jgi:Ca2+-binding RTX toxin-like protein
MRRTPAQFETVEPRRLLSSSTGEAKLSDATLQVRGPEKVGSAITVTQDTTANTLTVTIVTDTETPVTYTKTFDATGVNMVKVRGGKYADTISLVNVDGVTPFSLNSRVNGDKGNDTIVTGSGNDRIDGGHGNDVVHAGAGDDQLWGEKGSDQLFGEDGVDRLWGGTGDDTIDGGAGNDFIVTLLGNDSVVGGEGEDTFVVKKTRKGMVKDAGKHDHHKVVAKGGSDTDDAAPTA